MRFRALLLLALPGLLAGSPSLAASRWIPLGPFGGTVQTLTVDPADARVLYATLSMGGAFRSADGGASWIPVHDGIVESNVAVDPSRPGTIYLWAAPGGLRKSSDRGAHWIAMGLGSVEITRIAVDPARSSRLYAATRFNGILLSLDGGSHWQPPRVPPPLPADPAIPALEAVTRPAGTVFAVTSGGLFKSVNGGASWQLSSRGLPVEALRTVAASPSDPRTLYAGLVHQGSGVLFRSTDGGTHWRPTAGQPAPADDILAVAVSPRSPLVVWAATLPGGLFRSVDGGARWTPSGTWSGRRIQAVAVAPTSPRTLYVGVAPLGLDLGGVLASADQGVTWTRRNQGLAGLSSPRLALDPERPGVIWAGLSPQGLFRSGNGGKRWARASLRPPFSPPGDLPIQDLALPPSEPSTLYVTDGQRLWRTLDDGASWTLASSPESPGALPMDFLRADPADPSTLWSNSGAALTMSADGGATWRTVAVPGLSCGIFDLAFAPSPPSALYAAGAKEKDPGCSLTWGSIVRSTDGGATWSAADQGLKVSTVSSLAVDPADPSLVYAGAGGFYRGEAGVWKSPDGGTSWSPAGEALKRERISALAVSPLSGIVWAAVVDTNRGRIFRSGDAGTTWEERSDGLQTLFVGQLAIDPADPRRIYAATPGGIWRLEDDEP